MQILKLFHDARYKTTLCLLITIYNSLCLDLTHPVGDATVSWPTASEFRVTQAVSKDSGSGYWYEARDFSQAEHSGTHTDAPAHFYRDRWHTADIPLERLTGPAVKISIEVGCSIGAPTF